METLNLAPPDGSVKTLEQQIDDLQRRAERATQSTKKLYGYTKKLLGLVAVGDIVGAGRIAADIQSTLEPTARDVSSAVDIDLSAIDIAFRKTAYFDAVAAACQSLGLRSTRSTEGRLLSYPFSIERGKGSLALKIGRKIIRTIRPSAVAKFLAMESKRSLDFDRTSFLEALESAYRFVAAEKQTELVPVTDLYAALTLLPGTEKQYPYFEFLVNLNLIDRNGPRQTKSGRSIIFSGASTTRGGRGDVVVTENGHEVTYSMIAFRR